MTPITDALAEQGGEVKRLAGAMSLDLDDWQPGPPRISRQRDDTNGRFRNACLEAWQLVLLT